MRIKTTQPLWLSLYRGYLLGFFFLFFFVNVVEANQTIRSLPVFEFESFDGSKMTELSIQDKGIQLIIYGSPDALTQNRVQLDLVLDHIRSADKTDQLLYTINFSSYPRLIRGIIKSQMKNNSNQLGINIFADWDGVWCTHYHLDSSFVSVFLICENTNVCNWFYFKDAKETLTQIEERN